MSLEGPRTLRRLSSAALVVVLLSVPVQTGLAGHNSLGADVEFAMADEVDPETGELHPDLPEDSLYWTSTQRYQASFYESHGLPVRTGPSDQTGTGYEPGRCTPYTAFQEEAQNTEDQTAIELYENALPNHDVTGLETRNDACWVGFLDTQREYTLRGIDPGPELEFLLLGDDDPVYFLNPSEDDPDCAFGDPDDAFANECQKSGHPAYGYGTRSLSIDTDLVDAAFGGNDNDDPCEAPSCSGPDLAEGFESGDQTGGQGSGTLTLPLSTIQHTFLFGYPHPSNQASNPLTANSAVFSQPLANVPDTACGDRTPDPCALLTPEDLAAFDTQWEDSGLDEGDRGRVCYFTSTATFDPDTSSAGVPSPEAGGPCGVRGFEASFVPVTAAGGFGTGTVSTYQNTLPGFKDPRPTTPAAVGEAYAGTTRSLASGAFADHDDAPVHTVRSITAVNPVAPNLDAPVPNGQVWCLEPGLLTDETVLEHDRDGDGELETVRAPGVYGDYRAAAIDNDVHASGLDRPVQGVHDDAPYHETVDPAAHAARDAADAAVSVARDVAEEVGTGAETVEEALPEETPGGSLLEATDDNASQALGRLGPTESTDPEPMAQLGDANVDPFSVDLAEGISCTGTGELQFSAEPGSIPGATRYNAEVTRSTVAIKDPTIFDEDGLPAHENGTRDGTWQADQYRFSGTFQAFVDADRSGAFSGCQPSGDPAPDRDQCVWTAVWDAYNPACQDNSGQESVRCGEVLEANEYDVAGEEDDVYGVGTVATVRVTGPTVFHRPQALTAFHTTVDTVEAVNQDPTDTSCAILLSNGFEDKLLRHVGERGQAEWTDAVEAELCPVATEESGDVLVYEDAFLDQQTPDDEGFTSAVYWIKPAASPQAAQQLAETRDRLCVTTVFSTKSEVVSSGGVEGTENNVQLGNEATETYYNDCDPLTSEHAEQPTDATDADGLFHSFPTRSP